MSRFKANFISEDRDSEGRIQEAWEVLDTSNDQFRMPRRAVSLNMGRKSAEKIAGILNEEWAAFLKNPT